MPDSVVAFLTHFGEIQLFIVATVCIYWIICPRLGTRLWFALCLSSSIQQTLKMAFAQPRPYWLNPDLLAIEKSTSYGMPSGHAQTPPLFYGILAKSSRRRWAYFLAAAIVILTGWTRVVGNVHSIEQVFTGWTIGVLLLISIFLLEKPATRWWQKSSFIIRIAGSFAFCAVLMAFGLWAASHAGQQIIPVSWIENAEHPLRPVKADNIIIVPGLLFGWLLGLALLDGQYPRKPEKKLKLALRPLLGLPPIALLLETAPGKEIELILIITFLVGVLAGLWSSYGAPFLFKILKI
ncbi:phosphatase PAP2 family protein [Kiloniella majae]|uniref:phosphatase PAP2 family protein n=1 Tax=Kiloniella majae TaxID=1938558 RepID=UPI000A2785F1|nr:phosphatase PAP2 family protein [Kiloniella majae]